MLANNNQGGMPWPHTADILSTFCKQLQPVAPATTDLLGRVLKKKILEFSSTSRTQVETFEKQLHF